MAKLFGLHYSILILKVLSMEILCYLYHFNLLCMIQPWFSHFFKIPEIKEGGPNFFGIVNFAV